MEEMLRYIGTKIILAVAMNLGKYNEHRGWTIPADEDPAREGYLVEYEDGYQSWSPKEVFEAAYRLYDKMTFGLALEAMKKGKKVARAGWNGKDMFIYLQIGMDLTPESACRNEHLADYCRGQFEDKMMKFVEICSHIDMKAADGTIVVGWLASQTDMLSEDWQIVE